MSMIIIMENMSRVKDFLNNGLFAKINIEECEKEDIY